VVVNTGVYFLRSKTPEMKNPSGGLSLEYTMRTRILLLCLAVLSLCASSLFAQMQRQTLDFEDFAGPSRFDTAHPPVRELSASVSGGEVLRNPSRAPTGKTAVYGTSFACSGCLPEISIHFNQKVSDVQISLRSQHILAVSYTAEDEQGELQKVNLAEGFRPGADALELPFQNIRQITITDNAPDWSLTMDSVIFAAGNSPILIDPVVARLLKGPAVTTNVNALATATTGFVQGAAADGTAQVVIRIPAANVGQTFTITVINDQGQISTSVPNDGGVMALGANLNTLASSLTVTAVTTLKGTEAFAIYRGPVNFSRGSQDDDLTTRSVSLSAVSTSGTTNTAVTVARPPVVLVHGLWGDASSFDDFTPLITDTNFSISYAVYDAPITGITSTVPTFSSSIESTIEANSLGFAYNAPGVVTQIANFIAAYRTTANIAAVKADIVAHSMGGDITRTSLLLKGFLANNTFGAGPINKLITVATPHLGTPVAADMLTSSNSCVRNTLAGYGDIALQSVTFSGHTAHGAVVDLIGDGFGGGLSAALKNMKAVQPFPTAYIAGIATSTNLNSLNCLLCNAEALRVLCSGNPLAKDLTAKNWPKIFGQDNDTIVPLDSALNNLSGQQYSGVIHSAGLETLDFDGPSVLDAAPNISSEVITLLNESPTGSDFH
jgi:pimeloyl-ACP methyl ester carboxylesterase